jgi:hypothetical protein
MQLERCFYKLKLIAATRALARNIYLDVAHFAKIIYVVKLSVFERVGSNQLKQARRVEPSRYLKLTPSHARVVEHCGRSISRAELK